MVAGVFLSACIIASCSTNTHFPIPGGNDVTKNKISIEYLAIADAYADLGKYDKASDYYQLAMNDKKLYWSAYYKLGRTYALAKRWSDAAAVYEKLLERDPSNVSLKLSQAYIEAMSGNLDDALIIYKKLLEEYPDNETIPVNYIIVLLSQGRAELAEEQLELVKQKFPDNKSIADLSRKIHDALQGDGTAPPEPAGETPSEDAPAPAPAQ